MPYFDKFFENFSTWGGGAPSPKVEKYLYTAAYLIIFPNFHEFLYGFGQKYKDWKFYPIRGFGGGAPWRYRVFVIFLLSL